MRSWHGTRGSSVMGVVREEGRASWVCNDYCKDGIEGCETNSELYREGLGPWLLRLEVCHQRPIWGFHSLHQSPSSSRLLLYPSPPVQSPYHSTFTTFLSSFPFSNPCLYHIRHMAFHNMAQVIVPTCILPMALQPRIPSMTPRPPYVASPSFLPNAFRALQVPRPAKPKSSLARAYSIGRP